MTPTQKKTLDAIPIAELKAYLQVRRIAEGWHSDGSIPCPYAKIPGEQVCDSHDMSGCRWDGTTNPEKPTDPKE